MRTYAILCAAIVAALLALFGIATAADVQLLVSPGPILDRIGAVAAAVAVGLLIADVVLPVPSSPLMIWLGAAHGWIAGAALALVGCVGAACLAFWLGRRSQHLLSQRVSARDKQRADTALRRWGPLAIAVTRPVPILAETTALVAGTSPMRWRALVIAAVAGSAPVSLAYAATGAAIW